MANYFSIILTVVTLIAGALWLFDALVLKKKRAAGEPQNSVTEFGQSVFPILAIILVVRTFLYEPFQIPSGSMMPTLLKGDFILVEKYAYGLHDPLFQKEIVETGKPERGDIAVFKYPLEPSIDYIKRIIGDENCNAIRVENVMVDDAPVYYSGGSALTTYEAHMGSVTHQILLDSRVSPRVPYYFKQAGTQPTEFVVPEGHYFAMGDNRDNSEDSRYWGFVPEENLVGKAVFMWMSFEMDRSSESILPQWVPTGIRFERLGSIE